jgi:hypothetical protein
VLCALVEDFGATTNDSLVTLVGKLVCGFKDDINMDLEENV